MINTPYATPTSNLETVEPGGQAFYVVSKRKFLLLFLTTQGWFMTYWFYRNWKLYRAATGTDVMPKTRALFSVFFVYSLFVRIDRHIHASGRQYSWYPRLIAVVVILVMVSAAVQGWMIYPDLQIALALLSMLVQMVCLYYVQNAVNYGESDPEGSSNSALTTANVMWMLLGLCHWALVFTSFYWMSSADYAPFGS